MAMDKELYQTFGYALAMRVLQSDLYRLLDDTERAECDELIQRGQSSPQAMDKERGALVASVLEHIKLIPDDCAEHILLRRCAVALAAPQLDGVVVPREHHPDDDAVDMFAAAMKAKLAVKWALAILCILLVALTAGFWMGMQ